MPSDAASASADHVAGGFQGLQEGFRGGRVHKCQEERENDRGILSARPTARPGHDIPRFVNRDNRPAMLEPVIARPATRARHSHHKDGRSPS